MAENYKIFPLRALSGIKKDGTVTEGTYWNDGLWSRFYRGLPRSILGYRSMTNEYPETSRGIFVNLNGSGFLDIFSGSADYLSVGQFTTSGFGSGVTDITPSGFATDPNNVWQFDSLFNSNGGNYTALLSHAAPNLENIASNINTPIYYGDITIAVAPAPAYDDSSPTPQIVEVSGGVMALGPYAVGYGNGGLVTVSAPGNPALFPLAQQFNPTATKIVKGMQVRGSAAPAGLLWSLDSLLLMSFVGGDQIFSFETISDQSSILSSSAIVEKDGIYYWPGVDRWLTFNGSLTELPNELNADFFFKNLNFAQRQKVFGFKVPRWGEIWFCAPLFGATECNWAVIYNTRENTWYDTPLPTDGRSAAYFAQSWQYPVIFGANQRAGAYQLYQHEFQYDDVLGTQVNAIPSYILSPPACLVNGNLSFGVLASQPRFTQLVGFEPDFNYGTAIDIDILTRTFAQDTDITASENVLVQGTNYFDTQTQARYIRWEIGSNVQGGFYEMGTPLVRYREGDANP